MHCTCTGTVVWFYRSGRPIPRFFELLDYSADLRVVLQLYIIRSGSFGHMDGIPVIDISGLRSPDAEVRKQVSAIIGAACRDVGFFAISGHGVAPEIVSGAFAAARAFFALPLAAKTALAMKSETGNRGYVGVGVEQLDEKHGDEKEAFDLTLSTGCSEDSNEYPALPDWKPAVESYFAAMHSLGALLLRAFALDLHLEEDFFSSGMCRSALLRLLRYPAAAVPHGAHSDTPVIGAGEHTDYDNRGWTCGTRVLCRDHSAFVSMQ